MEQIIKSDIPREQGYLYFVKGNPICVYKTKMNRKGRKGKK